MYSFGALLKTTGVGSEEYDFSGISFVDGTKVGINAGGGIGGGGTLMGC